MPEAITRCQIDGSRTRTYHRDKMALLPLSYYPFSIAAGTLTRYSPQDGVFCHMFKLQRRAALAGLEPAVPRLTISRLTNLAIGH